MRNQTEETAIKSQVKDYLRLRGIFFYYNLQGVGAFKGLPDMAMHFEGQVHHLEIKKLKGVLSEHQQKFREQCELDGISYHVIRSLEDLMSIVG